MRALRLLVACVLPAVARAASAVAVLLTTKPSGKSDGWSPRSVKATDSSNACAAEQCVVVVEVEAARVGVEQIVEREQLVVGHAAVLPIIVDHTAFLIHSTS